MSVYSTVHLVRSMNCACTRHCPIEAHSGAYGAHYKLHRHCALLYECAEDYKSTRWCTWCIVYNEVYIVSALRSVRALCNFSMQCMCTQRCAWCTICIVSAPCTCSALFTWCTVIQHRQVTLKFARAVCCNCKCSVLYDCTHGNTVKIQYTQSYHELVHSSSAV